MGLELAGVSRIDTPAEARAHARAWAKMARELDTEDAPEQAQEKVRELRQRAKAANDWARREEDALVRGRQAHDAHLEHETKDNVVPIRGTASSRPRTSSAARRAGHAAYHATRPRAMRIVANGRQHFFQGLAEPFGPVGSGYELFMEALGMTLAVVVIADLLRSPGAIAEASTHGLGFLQRAAGLVDPITGRKVAAPAPTRPAAARAGAATTH